MRWLVAMDNEGNGIVADGNLSNLEAEKVAAYMKARGDSVICPKNLTYRDRKVTKVFIHASGAIALITVSLYTR